MAVPNPTRSLLGAAKRIKLSTSSRCFLSQCQRAGLADVPRNPTQEELLQKFSEPQTRKALSQDDIANLPKHLQSLDPKTRDTIVNMPMPRAVQALYLRPLRRTPEHGLPVCDLQLRSYSVRNLEHFADFAMRAAYYLGMPAKGPVPLPRLTESWTVPRSNFIFKKSQENFRRITLRRLIQIQDADPQTVQIWLGYLERRQFHGVGMKANIWEWEGLEVGKRMDAQGDAIDKSMEDVWRNVGTIKDAATPERLQKLLSDEVFSRTPKDMEAYYREPVEVKRSQ